MGQAPSVAELPPEWEDILPAVTREDILRSSRVHCRTVGEDKSSVYLDNDAFDLDEHVPMALAILRANPHLKNIRFKLVPGRMTEERYWAALFGILHDGGIDMEDVVGKIDDDYETGDEIDDNLDLSDNMDAVPPPVAQSPTPQPQPKKGELGRTPIANLDFQEEKNAPESFYLDKIKAQQAHIARLERGLREANHKSRELALELHKERSKRRGEGADAGAADGGADRAGSAAGPPRRDSSSTPQTPHTGTWEMHPDCNDFMQLDEHLKDNLRAEKKKRLNEVLSQMKFILDTDDIKDSYGKWSCCGKEEYETECSG